MWRVYNNDIPPFHDVQLQQITDVKSLSVTLGSHKIWRAWSLCVCAFLCTHAFLNTLHSLTTSPRLPPLEADLEARLSPPLLRHFERRERLGVTVRKIHLGDIAERGSPSLPARYLPRLAGDEGGGSHCSWLHLTVVVVAVWFLCRRCRYTHLELETKETEPLSSGDRDAIQLCTFSPAHESSSSAATRLGAASISEEAERLLAETATSKHRERLQNSQLSYAVRRGEESTIITKQHKRQPCMSCGGNSTSILHW